MRTLAMRTQASFILIRHLRKETGGKAIYRGTGSIGIVGAARAGLVVAVHPEDENLRVVATSKSNLAQRQRPLAFALMPNEEWACAFVDWRGPVDMSADQLLSGLKVNVIDGELRRCCQVIEQVLANGREVWSADLNAAAMEESHFSETMMRRAKAELGVLTRQCSEPGKRGWKVRLPYSE
jgi:hypothetical protein